MPQMHIFMGFGPWMLAAGVLHPCGPSLFNLVYTPCMFSVKPFTCRPGITIVVDGIKKNTNNYISLLCDIDSMHGSDFFHIVFLFFGCHSNAFFM